MDSSTLEDQTKQGVIYAMRLLMIAKRSESDIRVRLKDKGYPAEAIQAVVAQLKEKRYIDDVQLAKNYVQFAAPSKHLGRRRISLELRKKGVSRDVVQSALDALEPTEEKKAAQEIAELRYRKLANLDDQSRKKRVYDFLIRRGYDYGICRSIVEKLSKTHEND